VGQSAVDVDADRGAGDAEVSVSLAAERADAARVVGLDRHPVAGPDARDARADRLHDAD
jgi:hypothetical protein